MAGPIQPTTPPLPATPGNQTVTPEQMAKMRQSAQDFEAMALGEMLKPMFDTVDTSKSAFGGGSAEGQWRPLMIDAIGKQMAARGGLGLAEPVFKAMLRAQEHKS
jgi:peptidoglycan hydrolase FlgJ